MYQLLGHCSGVMDQILPKGPKVIFSRCSKTSLPFLSGCVWWRTKAQVRSDSIWPQMSSGGNFRGSQLFKLSITGCSESQVFLRVNVHIERTTSRLFQTENKLFWMKIWRKKYDVEIQIWTWGTFSDLRNGFLGLWVKQGWHRPLPSKRIIVRFNIYFLIMLIISHLMVDETSTVPGHAGERLVRELGGLPQSPDQLDQLDVISTLKISYFCKKST